MPFREVDPRGEVWTCDDGRRITFTLVPGYVLADNTRFGSLPQARAAHGLEPEPPPGSWSFDCAACQTRVHAPVAAMPERTGPDGVPRRFSQAVVKKSDSSTCAPSPSAARACST